MGERLWWLDSPKSVRLNNGEMKEFIYSSKDSLGREIVNYIVKKAHELGKKSFDSAELRIAPWMPTQSVVLHGTWFSSLQELADKVNRAI